MTDSHSSLSLEMKENGASTTGNNIGSSSSGWRPELNGDQIAQTDEMTLTCQKCGSYSISRSILQLKYNGTSQELGNTHANPAEAAGVQKKTSELGASGLDGSVGEDEITRPPVKRTRIGRIYTDKQGVTTVVDQTASDTDDLGFPNAGEFVFAIQREFNPSRMDIH